MTMFLSSSGINKNMFNWACTSYSNHETKKVEPMRCHFVPFVLCFFFCENITKTFELKCKQETKKVVNFGLGSLLTGEP